MNKHSLPMYSLEPQKLAAVKKKEIREGSIRVGVLVKKRNLFVDM